MLKRILPGSINCYIRHLKSTCLYYLLRTWSTMCYLS